jgi:hypothetical protein
MYFCVYIYIYRERERERKYTLVGALDTTAWYVLVLRIEERPPAMEDVPTLNKQPRTSDKGLSSSLEGGREANSSSP